MVKIRCGGALLVLSIAACGDDQRPPILTDYWSACAADCGVPQTDPTATTDAGECVPKWGGDRRQTPLRGTVVELDDPTFTIAADNPVRFAATTALKGGTIRVEAEKPGCGLASTVALADGSYTLEGAGTGEIFLRLVPIDRPDLMPSLMAAPDVDGVNVPIVSRRSVARLLDTVLPGVLPNPRNAQVVVSFVDVATPFRGLPGGSVAAPSGTIAYDGAGHTTGSLGLGVVVNSEAAPYPGNRIRLVAKYPEREDQEERSGSVVAQDAVTLFLVGFH